MALGAGYAGRVGITGSSGPGISENRTLGWAVMAEVPLIICDIQRGGPSTACYNVEQSDLNIACFGGHGDSRASSWPGQCGGLFYTAIEAVNIARKFNVPYHPQRSSDCHAHRGICTTTREGLQDILRISHPCRITKPTIFQR